MIAPGTCAQCGAPLPAPATIGVCEQCRVARLPDELRVALRVDVTERARQVWCHCFEAPWPPEWRVLLVDSLETADGQLARGLTDYGAREILLDRETDDVIEVLAHELVHLRDPSSADHGASFREGLADALDRLWGEYSVRRRLARCDLVGRIDGALTELSEALARIETNQARHAARAKEM